MLTPCDWAGERRRRQPGSQVACWLQLEERSGPQGSSFPGLLLRLFPRPLTTIPGDAPPYVGAFDGDENWAKFENAPDESQLLHGKHSYVGEDVFL